jgi:hypothetical protein
MKKLSLWALGLVCCVAAVAVAPAIAAKTETVRYESTITASYGERADNPYNQNDKPFARFKGEVGSEKKSCRKNRTVTVKSKATGDTVGTDTTNKKGKYRIDADLEQGEYGPYAPTGNYRVKAKKLVKEKNSGKVVVCKRARTTVKIAG